MTCCQESRLDRCVSDLWSVTAGEPHHEKLLLVWTATEDMFCCRGSKSLFASSSALAAVQSESNPASHSQCMMQWHKHTNKKRYIYTVMYIYIYIHIVYKYIHLYTLYIYIYIYICCYKGMDRYCAFLHCKFGQNCPWDGITVIGRKQYQTQSKYREVYTFDIIQYVGPDLLGIYIIERHLIWWSQNWSWDAPRFVRSTILRVQNEIGTARAENEVGIARKAFSY